MTEERYKWYQAEIARLKDIDKRISDRVRATYSLDKNKSGLLVHNTQSNTDI
jgi:hypothetical protein